MNATPASTTPANTSGLTLHDLTIGYRARRGPATVVADGLTATAAVGQLTALVGPNGSGKSTLLRTVSGLQPALAGTVSIDGRDLATTHRADLARTVAVVLTERVDAGFLNVRSLVALGRTPHLGVAARLGRTDNEVVDWALEVTGAAAFARRLAGELSDGQRQRVMIARALAQQPRLLLLDEPTSFLDLPSRVELLDLLARLAREQELAVLVSTHELELAMRLADTLWLLPGSADDSPGVLHAGPPRSLVAEIATAFDRGRVRFDADSLRFVLID